MEAENKGHIPLEVKEELLPADDPLALAAAFHQHLRAFQMGVVVADLAAPLA